MKAWGPTLTPPPEDFARRVLPRLVFLQRDHVEGVCWEWTGGRCGGLCRRTGDAKRYGRMRIQGHMVYVHRVVFYWWQGYWPPVVDHRHDCGSGTCVNPAYLHDATHRENSLRAAGTTNCGDPNAYLPDPVADVMIF